MYMKFLLLPYTMVHDMNEVKETVEHVNRVEVPLTDVLSDHVYLYDRERNTISII